MLAIVLPRFFGFWTGVGISVGVWLVLWWILQAVMVRPMEERMLGSSKDQEERKGPDESE
ncbi:MAG: hypothetical protein AB1512_08615 [Thermodesulfobacteriota bacterium]